jgi:uncharacterized protein YerC
MGKIFTNEDYEKRVYNNIQNLLELNKNRKSDEFKQKLKDEIENVKNNHAQFRQKYFTENKEVKPIPEHKIMWVLTLLKKGYSYRLIEETTGVSKSSVCIIKRKHELELQENRLILRRKLYKI